MRLLMICINYPPEIISTGVYTTGFADHMARNDVETDVITALPYYPAWRTFDGWRRPFWKARTSDNGVRFVHCPIYVPKTPTGVRRILHYLSFALAALPIALWKALARRPDMVVLVAPTILMTPVARMAARLSGAPAWLHVQDFEVGAAFATGLMREDSRIGRAAVAFENWALHRFDRVSTISDQMLNRLRDKGLPEERLFEFRNWSDLSRIVPLDGPSPLRDELGITTRYVALYSGNLANKQGLEVLPGMARALAHRDDLTIAICGDGPMRGPLQAQTRDLPMVKFFPLQPVEKLSALLGMADVHLLPQIAGVSDLLLPSKLTNMLASGRPVVATTLPDTALGREVDGVGRLVPPGDPAALARAIGDLLDDPATRAELGRKARARALDRWDMEAILSRVQTEMELLSAAASPSGRTT